MRTRRSIRDETLEAILHGKTLGQPDDLASVAGLAADLRAAYEVEALQPSDELAAFMAAPLAPGQMASDAPSIRRHAPHRRKTRMLSGLSGFLATLTGKVVLGTAVAAASVGALHAGEVVDVPGLPDTDRAVEQEEVVADENGNGNGTDDLPDEAVAGQQTAEDNRAAAEAYTDAVREWTDCVSENASAQGDESTRTTGGFDPREGCGDHPRPADFRLSDVPSQAEDRDDNGEGGPPEDTPGRDDTPGAGGTPGEGNGPDSGDGTDEDPDEIDENVPENAGGGGGAGRAGDHRR